MKRVFEFKAGQLWDGDEAIFAIIEEYLGVYDGNTHSIKKDSKITLILERL